MNTQKTQPKGETAELRDDWLYPLFIVRDKIVNAVCIDGESGGLAIFPNHEHAQMFIDNWEPSDERKSLDIVCKTFTPTPPPSLERMRCPTCGLFAWKDSETDFSHTCPNSHRFNATPAAHPSGDRVDMTSPHLCRLKLPVSVEVGSESNLAHHIRSSDGAIFAAMETHPDVGKFLADCINYACAPPVAEMDGDMVEQRACDYIQRECARASEWHGIEVRHLVAFAMSELSTLRRELDEARALAEHYGNPENWTRASDELTSWEKVLIGTGHGYKKAQKFLAQYPKEKGK